MNLSRILTPAVVLVAIAAAAPPASAQHRGHGGGGGGSVGHAVPRASVGPRGVGGPHVVGSRVIGVAPYRFYRPYYVFRPRVSLGFGLFVGYPVTFPYYYGPYPYGAAYPYPYPYPYAAAAPPPAAAYPPPAAAYPPSNSGVAVQPGATSSAGLSFEITPADADIYVDGAYVGRVSDFGPQSQPLGLAPGRHRIEIRRSGYQMMSFDTDAIAGEVIPYQGTMQPGH